jgi:hypothetical protein
MSCKQETNLDDAATALAEGVELLLCELDFDKVARNVVRVNLPIDLCWPPHPADVVCLISWVHARFW